MLERVLLLSRIREGIAVADLQADKRTRVAGLIADGLVDPAAAVRGRVQLTLRGRLLADRAESVSYTHLTLPTKA